MWEDVETVNECCKHKDCIYRKPIGANYNEQCCYYAVMEQQVRGCKISECDKYKPGKPKQARMNENIYIEWEYDLYGNDYSV